MGRRMGCGMRRRRITRREIIALLGAAVAWPVALHAQQTTPKIGVLRTGSPDQLPHLRTAFHQGLAETGFIEHQNLVVEYRWAEGHYDRMPELLNDLVRRQVSVIAAPGSTISALAAKAATQTIPVVFAIGSDPVEFGLVSSLGRPGGNLTGIAQLIVAVAAKRLEVLHQLAPKAERIALLINPTNPFGEAEAREVQAAARALKLEISTLRASTTDGIDAAFATMKTDGIGALLLGADAFLLQQSGPIAIHAARYGIPAVSHYREFPTTGGLMSYGNDLIEAYRLTGVYVGRILKGEKPGDLPVMQPTKFDLVINLRTAKALGLEMPDKLLALANQVIE